MGEPHFQGSAGQKPLDRSKWKLAQFITLARWPNMPKLIAIPSGVSCPQYGEVAGWLVLFFCFFLLFVNSCTAQTPGSILTLDTSNDAVSAKEVPFGGLIDNKCQLGGILPQKPKFLGAGIGISCLNEITYNFTAVWPISARNIPIDAAWREWYHDYPKKFENSI